MDQFCRNFTITFGTWFYCLLLLCSVTSFAKSTILKKKKIPKKKKHNLLLNLLTANLTEWFLTMGKRCGWKLCPSASVWPVRTELFGSELGVRNRAALPLGRLCWPQPPLSYVCKVLKCCDPQVFTLQEKVMEKFKNILKACNCWSISVFKCQTWVSLSVFRSL